MTGQKTGLRTTRRIARTVFVLAPAVALILSPFAQVFANTTPPSIPNQNAFTSQNPVPQVDGTSGALTETIPLDIPPGRNGIQPDLSLNYNSQDTEDSIVGYGWSLSVPYVQVLNKTGSQNLYVPTPYYTSSIDGELASSTVASSTIYRAKVDEGNFDQYSYATSTNTWTMYDKNGARYLFGASDQSRLESTSSPALVYRWMLEEIRDPNSNYAKFVYHKDGNQIYPYQIIYTGNSSTDGSATITFATSTRPDPYTSYKSAFRVDTNYYITQITTAFNGTSVRQYNLYYASGNNGVRSMLASIQQNGWNDQSTEVSEPAMTFGYVSTSTMFYTPGNPNNLITSPADVVSDVNGDGRNDTTIFQIGANPPPTAGTVIPDNGPSTSDVGVSPPDYYADSHGQPWERGARLLDINGDGKADLVRGSAYGSNHTIYLNTSTSTYSWASTTYTGVIPDIEGGTQGLTTGIFADVNGDGLPDFVQRVDGGFYSSAAYLGNGSAWDNATSTIFTPPESFPAPGTPTGTNSQLVDLAGDGLPDWVYSDPSTGKTYVLLNNGKGWNSTPDPRWTIGTTTLFQTTNGLGTVYLDRGIRFFDINGDGLPDMIHSYSLAQPSSSLAGTPNPEIATYSQVFLNTGSGWATSTAYTLPATIQTGLLVSGQWQGNFSYDEYENWIGNGQMDQDVLSSITYPRGGSSTITYTTTTHDQGATSQGLNYQLPTALLLVSKVVTSDNNGNSSETDYSDAGGKLYLAQGPRERKFAGFSTVTATSSNAVTTTFYDQGDSSLDTSLGEQSDGYAQINHPFRQDIFNLSDNLLQRTYYRWDVDPNPNATSSSAFPSTNLVGYWKLDESSGSASDSSGNGNSLTNNNTITYGSGKINNAATLASASNQYFSITNGSQTHLGDNSNYTYAGWVKFTTLPSAGNYYAFVRKFHGGSFTNPGVEFDMYNSGGTYYIHAQWGEPDSPGNGATSATAPWSGLATGTWYYVAATLNPSTETIQLYINGVSQTVSYGATGSAGAIGTNTSPFCFGAYCDPGGSGYGQYLNGSLDEWGVWNKVLSSSDISTLYNSGTGLSYTTPTTTPPYPSYLHLGQKIVESYASDGSHADKATTYQYATSTDNLIQQNDYGQVVASSTGTFADTGNDDRTTLFSYAASSSINLYVPTEKTVLNASSSTSTDERLYYDNLSIGSVNVGNQTKDENLISGSQYASSTKTYNSYGLIATSTDPLSHSTAYIYDSFNLYPSTTTNALSQKTGSLYNYSNGKVRQTNDSNGKVIQYLFDGIGRPTQVSESDVSTPSTLDTKTTNAYTDNTTTPSIVHESDYLTSTSTADKYDYFDGLGRLIQERRSTENSGISTVIDHVFNPAGVEASTSLPYFSSGTSFTSPTTTATLFTTFTYDTLQRPTKITTNVGSTTYSYAGWVATSTNPDGNVKAQILDAYGNLAQVNEVNGTSTYQTLYTYDAANNLTKLTDANGNVRNFTYDGLNRRLTAQDLHAPSNGLFGTWNYAYDLAGNVASTSDPKGQEVDYTYDALNRPLTENYVASSTLTSYGYDSCTDGIGYLCNATSTGAQVAYAYDIVGRASSATTTISGNSYATSYLYNLQDNPASIVYPDGRTVSYGYNAGGLVGSVSTKVPGGGSFAPVAGLLAYDPTQQVLTLPFGNGATSTYTRDPLQLYRLASILSASGATSSTITINGVATSSLVAYWKFDETSGSPSDSTSNANNLTNNNTATFSAGQVNNAVNLIGASSQYLSITNANQTHLGDNSNYTYAGWVKFTTLPSVGNYYAFVRKFHGGSFTNPGVEFDMYNSGGTYYIHAQWGEPDSSGNGTTGAHATWSGLTAGTWYYVAATLQPSTETIQLFINGTSQTVTYDARGSAGAIGTNTSPFCLGAYCDPGGAGYGQYLNGSLDEWGVWNRVLASGELTWAYNSGIGSSYATSTVSTSSYSNVFQNLSYTYDAAGNITQIVDKANTGTGLSLSLTYDPLNRLSSASTTFATSTPYDETFSYDPLGDITNKSDVGAYTYSSSGIQNPQAPISVNGITQTYDKDGNLTGASPWTYAWDYRNRLINATNGSASSTYQYDYQTNRVFQLTATSATYYPNKYFSIASTTVGSKSFATSTDYIYLPGQGSAQDILIGEINQPMLNGTATGTPKTYYVHTDILGSIDALSDVSGTPQQALSFYPYGSERIASSSPGIDSLKKYIGNYFDPATSLIYLNARYYSPTQGQFLSEDPTFLAVGNPAQVEGLTGENTQRYLSDPQQLDSYSYARDNPVINKDPSGNAFGVDDVAGFIGGGAIGSVAYYLTSVATHQTPTWSGAAGAFVTGGIIGWGAVNTPETLGASNAVSASIITGLIGGYYGNLTKQEIDIATGEQKGGLDYNDLEVSALTTAGTNGVLQGVVTNARIPGLSAGQGNMYATGQSMLTKSANGTISNISFSTGVKSAVGSQAVDLYRSVIGLLTQIVSTLSQNANQSNKK